MMPTTPTLEAVFTRHICKTSKPNVLAVEIYFDFDYTTSMLWECKLFNKLLQCPLVKYFLTGREKERE